MEAMITPANINPSCNSCGVHHTGRCQFRKTSPEDDIRWSEHSYSLQDMHETFSSRVPYLARVGLGDFGETEESTIEVGQVLRVEDHYVQERIIGINEKGEVLSIPLSLPLKFDTLRSKSNNVTTRITDTVRAFSRGKVLADFTKKLPITVVLCENAYSTDVRSKAPYSYDDVRQLTLTRVHKYYYLICNEVTGGALNTQNTLLLPTFVKMKLQISTQGLKTGSQYSEEQLQQLQDSLKESAQQINYDAILDPQEIFHYKGSYDRDTLYEGLQPMNYEQNLYARRRHPLVALVSSHGHSFVNRFRKALSPSNPASPHERVEEAGGGIYETIELTKDTCDHKKFKPVPPPKPSMEPRVEGPPPPLRPRNNVYDVPAPANPAAMGHQYVNASRQPAPLQLELAQKLKTQRSQSQPQAYEDITVLTVLEVGDILDKLNLRKYKLKFFHRQIDGSILKDLVEDEKFDFMSQFGMDDLEVKKLRKCVRENWLPNL